MGALLVLGAAAPLLYVHHWATDFPTEGPVRVIDQELVERLRANPGLHLALAPRYELRVSLKLADDPLNRFVYGTSLDLREQVAERAIHIQRKGARAAIHTDGHNPASGWRGWLLHGLVDVPVLPLPLVALLGLLLFIRGGAPAPRPAPAVVCPASPASEPAPED